MMRGAIRARGWCLSERYQARADITEAQAAAAAVVYPPWGLVRIQWAGPWTHPGVPSVARYRYTHWIAYSQMGDIPFIFDINAMCVGGWLDANEWLGQLAPQLQHEISPKITGWWVTHSWGVDDLPF